MMIYAAMIPARKGCVDWVDRLKRPNRFYTIAVANAYCLISELQDVSADFPKRSPTGIFGTRRYSEYICIFDQYSSKSVCGYVAH